MVNLALYLIIYHYKNFVKYAPCRFWYLIKNLHGLAGRELSAQKLFMYVIFQMNTHAL